MKIVQEFRYVALLLCAATLCLKVVGSAAPSPELLRDSWTALWIEHPETEPHGYGVYLFRKGIELEARPGSFVINVSADNRYQLFVNGQLVHLGPARGDFYHWKFDTMDIAPYLAAGKNVVAAVVWNDGEEMSEAQMSFRTGGVVQGTGEAERVLDTNETWASFRCAGYAPLTGIGYNTYYVAGPGEVLDMARYPRGWMETDFDDAEWVQARKVFSWRPEARPKGSRDAPGWMLVERGIPLLDLKRIQFAEVREASGVEAKAGFLKGEEPMVVPAGGTAKVLLDNGVLTNALAWLEFSGGKGAVIEMGYAESLFTSDPATSRMAKGNRDEVAGKYFAGRRDRILSSGEAGQRFLSLDWRTYRYVELTVTTAGEALEIGAIGGVAVGYPFRREARFEAAGGAQLDAILEVGRRTAELCAIETYMDCPYYEELQYIGDTRIQALVSYFEFGDSRLARSALEQMDQSRLAEGVTLSRHPSKTPQIISTFSLWYIAMLRDYWWYRDDPEFVAEKLSGARGVLEFFARYQNEDGTLRRPPYWLFTDWMSGSRGWDFGEGPFGEQEESSIMDLQLLWAYQAAAEMVGALGRAEFAEEYAGKARQLRASVRKRYWDEERGLFRDTLGADAPVSQHANALAILTGCVEGEEAKRLGEKIRDDGSLAQASIFFRYYVHQAMIEAGLGDGYVDWLEVWRENLRLGLTTWAEISDIDGSRSDCHAWGSSPNIELYRTLLGVDSAAPGFARARIEPRLGALEKASGTVPHPAGRIEVRYEKAAHGWTAEIELPSGVGGELVWRGKSFSLNPGANRLEGLSD